MNEENFPTAYGHSVVAGYTVLVTKHAMKLVADPEKAESTNRAVDRALDFAAGVDFDRPRTVMIEGCLLGVHVDPKWRVVIILAKFPGWPAVTDNLVEELMPFSTAIALS